MRRPEQKALFIFLFIYGTASFIHFTHNAEFLADYPNIPISWSRAGVYFAWVGLTVVGIGGWILVAQGYWFGGLLLLAVYGVLGLASLSHYLLAPLSDHTRTMNLTILFEVFAAMLVLIEAVRQMVRRILWRGFPDDA